MSDRHTGTVQTLIYWFAANKLLYHFYIILHFLSVKVFKHVHFKIYINVPMILSGKIY